MGSYVKEILAANAMVTIVITGKKKQNKQTNKKKKTQYFDPRNQTLDQPQFWDGDPDADLRVCTEMICFQLPFQSSATMLSSDFSRE